MNDNINVLIIEENRIDSILTETILRKETQANTDTSFNITCVKLFSEAVEILQQKDFDIILLDLNLPDQKGIDTFKNVHKQKKYIPIIVISSSFQRDLALNIIRAGGEDFIVKGKVVSHPLVNSILFAIERNKIKLSLTDKKIPNSVYI